MSDSEAFEKWAQGTFFLGWNNGRYSVYTTQRAWEAWQAAQAQTLLEVIRTPPAADVRWRGRVARPEKCPSCGDTIGALASLVKLGNGPWTCDRCDGNVISKAASRQEVGDE